MYEQFCGELLQRPRMGGAHSVELGVKISTSCSKSPQPLRTHSEVCMLFVLGGEVRYLDRFRWPLCASCAVCPFQCTCSYSSPLRTISVGADPAAVRLREDRRADPAGLPQLGASCTIVLAEPRSGCPCGLDSAVQQTCLDWLLWMRPLHLF